MTEKPINIITLILKKYNEKFDENENENEKNIETNKIKTENELIFKKLLLEVDKAEKETTCNEDFKELFTNKKNIPQIHKMNFIQDINMVRNIVTYRKLEIKRQIRIVSLAIQVYKYVLIKLKCYNYFKNYTNNQLKLNTQNYDIEELKNDKQKCINIFNKYIFNNEHFLQDTLCRYIELEKKLQQFSRTYTQPIK